MQTISQAAKKFKLSRSTLLYYDRIGLLCPAERTAAGYRIYSRADMQRLEKICFFRRTGASLEEVRRMLDASGSTLRSILEKRLTDLNQAIHRLRAQQQVIVKILKHHRLPELIRGMDKAKWVALLRAVGLDEEGMYQWHVEFERLAPQGHHDFLGSLGMVESEILAIRKWAGAGLK